MPLRLGGSASEVFTQNIAAELVRCLQSQFAAAAPTKSLPDASGGQASLASTPSASGVPASTVPASSVAKKADDQNQKVPVSTEPVVKKGEDQNQNVPAPTEPSSSVAEKAKDQKETEDKADQSENGNANAAQCNWCGGDSWCSSSQS